MIIKHVIKNLAVSGMLLASGSAAAQDLSGIYNVDLATGIANINIPVTSFAMGGNDFGTSVSYNTKGVPVREFAGIVGAHWNLNIGGGIQRVIKGLPDEWYSRGSYLDGGTNLAHPDYIPLLKYHQYRGRLIEGMETTAQKQDAGVFRDNESDEYFFGVGAIQFAFYIGRGGQIYCNTKDKYEVAILALDGTNYTDRVLGAPTHHPVGGNTGLLQHFTFKVKDVQNGMTYHFSPSNLALYNVQPYFRSNYKLDINAYCEDDDNIGIGGKNTKVFVGWKLDSVLSSQNERIEYSYEKFITPPAFVNEYWQKAKLENSNTTAPDYFPSSFSNTFKSQSNNPSYVYLVDTSYLVTRVTYPNNTRIDLNYDKTNARLEYYSKTYNGTQTSFTPIWTNVPSYYFSKLDNIQFVENSNARIYKFDYSYFHTPSSASNAEETNTHFGDEDDRYSLKLKGISVRDNHTGQYMPLYNFGYNNKKQRRNGSGLDYFGYFRGGSTNGEPNFGREGHSLASDHNRTSDLTFMQYGMLTNITNGQGGRLSLTYGIHQLQKVSSPLTNFPGNLLNYWKEVPVDGNGNTTGDGLKIVTAAWTDDNNLQVGNYVQYQFTDGQFFLPGAFYAQPTHFHEQNANLISGTYESESMANPGYLFRGANHSYGQVKEIYASIIGELHGMKETVFSNFSDISGTKAFVNGGGKKHVGFPYTQKGYLKSWEIGLPRQIKTYDSKQLLTKEEFIDYEYFLDTVSARNAKVLDTNRVVSYFLKNRQFFFNTENCQDAFLYVLSLDPYVPYRGEALLKSVLTRSYISDAAYYDDFVQYNYDSRQNIKTALKRNSKGEMIETYNTYNYDISGSSNPTLIKMQTEGMNYLVAAEEWNNGASTATRSTASKLIKGTIFHYDLEGNTIYSKRVLETALESPLSYSSYMSGGSGDIGGPVIATYTGVAPASFMEEITDVKARDTRGNPLETYLPQSALYKSMIWDTLSGQKLADVVGARYRNIAYSSFEYGNAHNLQVVDAYILNVTGNGIVVPGDFSEFIPVSQALTGNNFCLLKKGPSLEKRVYTNGLEPGIRYRATFWASANTLPEFGIEGGTQFALTQIAEKGSYKQYEVFFTPTATAQKIGLSSPSVNVAIDELRIHPVEAQMTTYVYQPLNGKVAEADPFGRIIFYEYDGMGRLKLTRSQEGHIIQKQAYGVQVTQ